ncbi:unnamed protein product [Chrysoparadoxa australica]
MPLRGDFDVEHENDAEQMLADMEFIPGEGESERALKQDVIAMYNQKLDERARRKQFVIERGLLDYKRLQAIERKRPKEDRELIARMRPFARFHTKEEHEGFVANLLKAKRLRRRIEQLQSYRRMGMTRLTEGEAYEAEKKKRMEEQAHKKQRESAAYLYESYASRTGGKDRTNRSVQSYMYLNREGVSDLQAPEPPKSPILDISDAPGVELLTEREKKLCGVLHLMPRQYLTIKDSIVREAFKQGYISKATAGQLVKIDVRKTNTIYDFFVSCGWVTAAN